MNVAPRLTNGTIVLGLIALVFVARWLRGRSYYKVFRIPSRRDDAFVCRGDHPTFSVSAESDGFDLPPGLARRGQTAFLVLTVRATPKGRWIDPFIESGQGECRHRQYFERGASGRRYLNLSPLFASGDETAFVRIRLRGSSIRWQRDAELMLFDAPPIANAEILVLAAHPDDAEIAAFGLYAHAQSWVVTVTAGEWAMTDLAVVRRGAEATRWNALVRVWDSLTIPQLGGVPQERCVNLVYPDNRLPKMRAEPSRPFQIGCEASLPRAALRSRNAMADFQEADSICTWEGLVEDFRRLLEKSKPDIVVCPHPLVDGHHDHVFTTVALEQAARDVSSKNRLFFLYVVHRRDVPLYPFGPATALVSPPPWSEKQWLADGIYSHPLPPETRTEKYFAVEAAHDLRTYSTGAARTARQALASIKREVGALAGGTGLPAATFHRRAPRPNEIYGVVSLESLSDLVERALSRYGMTRN
jgi:LmbE family N-acetylglucosaminyl deacetylase